MNCKNGQRTQSKHIKYIIQANKLTILCSGSGYDVSFAPVTERWMYEQLQSTPIKMTTNKPEEEIEHLYKSLTDILKGIRKKERGWFKSQDGFIAAGYIYNIQKEK